ncbi:MAG: hypothetical protein ACRCSC_01870, partial [Lactococcus garvieae]
MTDIDSEKTEKSSKIALAAYYANWLSTTKKGSQEYESICNEAWAEYLAKNANTSPNSSEYKKDDNITRYPIFWSVIENLQPAYYARTPETVAKRMFDHDDDVARVACLILERLSKYLLEVYPIDTAMSNAVLEFLISGRGTARIFLEEEKEIVTTSEEILLIQDPTTLQFLDQNGQPVDTATGVYQKETGEFFTVKEQTSEQVVKVCTHILPLNFEDIYINLNARNWSQVTRMAIKLWLTKAEFKEKFGEELANNINYETLKQKETNKEEKSFKVSEGVEVFEIWDLPKKKVIYICENYKDDVLLELKDPYQLKGFFPVAPFVISTKDPKSLFPTPMYVQLKSTIR